MDPFEKPKDLDPEATKGLEAFLVERDAKEAIKEHEAIQERISNLQGRNMREKETGKIFTIMEISSSGALIGRLSRLGESKGVKFRSEKMPIAELEKRFELLPSEAPGEKREE